jgi:signal transduction histidine kinase
MTRRILVGFLGVLVVVILAVVVPLGIVVSSQQTNDFRSGTQDADRAVAAVAEEHLDDKAPLTGLRTVVRRFAAGGDRIAVLKPDGRMIVRAGEPVPSAVLAAALANQQLPDVHDALVAAAPIGDADRHLGVAVLVRDAEPLDHRHAVLWATLALAGAVTMLVGALVGWLIGRWITRPLGSLVDAAHSIGAGKVTARAADDVGPAQVREVGTAFNDMADRVAALVEVQRGMTADVSHQLRTPLAALRLRLELLAGEVEAEHHDEVTAMIDETNRLARLVDGLLAVARAEATAPAPEAVDLAELAAARVDAWQPVAAERGVELRLEAEDAIGWATPGHPEQILDNLLDNAIEAVSNGGHITVRVNSRDRAVALSIADDGPGMTADQRARALDRFATDRDSTGATGLGLAIVNRLVTADHAKLTFDETPGGGLTVCVTFPIDRTRSAAGRA